MRDMMSLPPISKDALTPPEELCKRLSSLIGKKFPLSGKTRTDGSKMRKLIECTLISEGGLPAPAPEGTYQIVPPKAKGVPKIRLEFIDSYIVTSGKSYNLQVWNRNPATDSIQIEYSNGQSLSANDVRFVFTKVNVTTHEIESVVILSPDYIVKNFGQFGKPTIKHQLIITETMRQKILSNNEPILFYPDSQSVQGLLSEDLPCEGISIHDEPTNGKVLKLEVIRDIVLKNLIGTKLDAMPTKNRGQALELKVSQLLGYKPSDQELLAGGYPDIRNQMLEVKVQDSPTVDLGKYSPQFEEELPSYPKFTTLSVRYLIALTDKDSGIVKGAVLCPGEHLGEHFTYVGDKSFKCQRSIPMSFFEQFKGKAVYNPDI